MGSRSPSAPFAPRPRIRSTVARSAFISSPLVSVGVAIKILLHMIIVNSDAHDDAACDFRYRLGGEARPRKTKELGGLGIGSGWPLACNEHCV